MRFFAPRTTTNSFKTHSAWVPGSGLVQIAVSSMLRLDCPNSTQLYLRSTVDTALQIWACDRDGSNCGQLTSLGGHAGAPRWSPDGRFVVFEFRPKKHSEVFVVEVPGGVPRLVPTLPGSDNGGPNWSRDGQWIYFYSDRGGGRFQLWKVPLKGGAPIQVTRNGGIFGTESQDGRFLYYKKLGEGGIWRMPLQGGEETRVFEQTGGAGWSSWALAQNGIYFLGHFNDPSHETVQFFDFATHKIIPIWTLEKAGSSSRGLALSADGRSIIYPQIEFEQSNIMLVKNFR